MDDALRPVSVRLRPTRVGGGLLLVTAASYLLAWSGAGVVFPVVAMFGTALLGVAAASAWLRTSALRVVAPAPATAFAGERFVLDVPVENRARRGAAFDVVLTVRPPRRDRERVAAFLPRLDARSRTTVAADHPPLRRGRHEQGRLELVSSFPLGLVACTVAFDLPETVLVLPRLGSVRRLDGAERRARAGDLHGLRGRGDEQEVYGLRPWRDGESLRPVHWKMSARRGRLVTREFRGEPAPPVHVVLVAAAPTATRAERGAFEDAVSLAATLVEHHARRGQTVRLTVVGAGRRTISCARGRGGPVAALRALAEVEAAAPAPDARAVTLASLAGERTFVVRAGDAGPSVATTRAGGSLRVLDVASRATDAVFARHRAAGAGALLGVRR